MVDRSASPALFQMERPARQESSRASLPRQPDFRRPAMASYRRGRGSGEVAPYTAPRRIPQPAINIEKPCGQWSRPAAGLINGVRPNSPPQTTSVVSRRSCSSRRVNNADKPASKDFTLARLAFVIVDVGVPPGQRNLDRARPDLDQTCRRQTAATKGGVAELVTYGAAVHLKHRMR